MIMKNLLSFIFIYFSITPTINAQLTDLKLANNLSGQNKDSVEVILDRSGNDYTVTNIEETNGRTVYNIFIEGKYGGVRGELRQL